jgi:anti-anti-sigma factor
MDSNRVRVVELAEHLWVVELEDEHDLSTADHVEAAIHRVPRSGSTLVLDLSGATFIDSTVLAAILRAQDAADLNGQDGFVVVAPQGSQPRRLLDLVAVGDRVQIRDSRPRAIAMLSGR